MSAKVAFSVAAALVLALAACGDGGPPDATDVYADAGEKMAALASYHVTVETQGGEEPGSFEVDFVAPDRFELSFTDNGESFTVIGIGDQLYVQITEFSPDYFIAPEEGFFGPGGPAAFLTALTTQISDLTYVAEETVEGVSTHHLQGTLAGQVLALVEPEEQHPESVTVELWVGVEDSLVHRYRWVEFDETTTLTLSRFNDEAISIEAPADVRPAEELEELFGAPPLPTAEEAKEFIEGLSAEEENCLRRVLGDAAFEELKAGTRGPTAEEFQQGEECFVP